VDIILGGLAILVLSFVPMLAYAWMLSWLDRYEKEPFGLLVVGFLWGAVPSIALALILQVVLDIPLMAIQGSSQLTYDLLGASVVAPLTEEGIKVLALLALLLLMRREIDSPIDGLIYGGVVGFGFAAVENAFYFLGALSERGIGSVFGLAFLRAGVFGLNHAMYTGFAGLGIALSLEVRRKAWRPLVVLGGFALAVGAHALHNALATFTSYGGMVSLLLAVLLDWGGVVVLLGVALAAYYVERQRIITYAAALVQAQDIAADEAAVLASTFQRRLARLNALLNGDLRRWRLLRRYYQAVSEAAFAWHRMKRGDGAAGPRFTQLRHQHAGLRAQLTRSTT
jgi:RsiW-degrading membrane proteinase PrsW (M82 family)